VAGNGVSGKLVCGMKGCRGIAGPTAKAGPDWNALRKCQVNGETVTDSLQDSRGGSDRKILLGRADVVSRNFDRNSLALAPLGSNGVRQTHETE
jgi:hypothetical protein